MRNYFYNPKLIIKIIKKSLHSFKQLITVGKKQHFSFDTLRSYVNASVQNTLDIPYDNYSAENLIYIDEICHELHKVFLLKNEAERKIYVDKFENEYAGYFKVPYAKAVSSGTTALSFSLIALGIGPGDEVITTPHTYIATALAITDTGATPVFADIGEDYNIRPDKIEERISPKTKAIIPVHLYGKPCSIDQIADIARRHRLYIVEDACQAHGAATRRRKVGTFGEAGCFSFHSSKIIGSLGDGGMVITSNRTFASKIAELREPIFNKFEILKSHRTPACLDPIHIPFLTVKLKHIEEITKRRKILADIYNDYLADLPGIIIPRQESGDCHAYRNYTVRVQDREGLIKYLFNNGIEAKIFYEIALHLRNEFKYLGYQQGDFPVCEQFYKEIVSLPISHYLKPEQIEFISKKIREYYRY